MEGIGSYLDEQKDRLVGLIADEMAENFIELVLPEIPEAPALMLEPKRKSKRINRKQRERGF